MKLSAAMRRRLSAALSARGAYLDVGDGVMTLDFDGLEGERLKDIKDIVYAVLNNCEKDCFVRIKGIPPCLAPDAWDHFVQERHKDADCTRLAICRSCRCRFVCPGLKKGLLTWKFEFKPVPDLPSDIVFEVNKECNLGCHFCSQGASMGGSSLLPFGAIRQTVDEARTLGVKNLRFTGGEPLLRPDLPRILKFAKSMSMTVFLNTNATLLTDLLLAQIEPYVDDVLVSLVGFSARSENLLGSRGELFRRKIENIRKLRRSNIPKVRLGTVISRMLLDHFSSYARLVRALGPDAWEFYRPMVPPTSVRSISAYNMAFEDYDRLFRRMGSFSDSGIEVYIANAFPFCAVKKSQYRMFLKGARFDDGHGRLVMDAAGFFKPSYFIDKNLGTTLRRAWGHAFTKKMNSLAYLGGTCRECIYLRWCCGGSRYLAMAESGDYFSPDPLLKGNDVA